MRVPSLLREAVYGLPEWNAKAIASARLIANPGCYPTSVALALLPLIRAGMLEIGLSYYQRFQVRRDRRRAWGETGDYVFRSCGKFSPLQSHHAQARA